MGYSQHKDGSEDWTTARTHWTTATTDYLLWTSWILNFGFWIFHFLGFFVFYTISYLYPKFRLHRSGGP